MSISFIVMILIGGIYFWLGQKELAWKTAFAFILGALCSAIAGIIGMVVAVRANIRTAAAASRSMNEALTIALRGGAVSALSVVSLSLLGVAGLYYFFGGGNI